MILSLRMLLIVLVATLAYFNVSCSGGEKVSKQNVQAMDVIQKQELGEMDSIHKLDIHLDEGDELHDKYERAFAKPIEEHPPTR